MSLHSWLMDMGVHTEESAHAGCLSAFCCFEDVSSAGESKGLPFCLPPAVKPWKQDRTETEKREEEW